MTTRNDLPEAITLVAQYNTLQRALAIVTRGATISNLTVADKSETEAGDSVQISAEGIAYPPQMLDAIRTQLQARINQINSQLTALGVTA
jgi:hypothetical protein